MELKEITYDQVELLWHVDWYDGELAGFLNYQGIFCYFVILNQCDPKVDTDWYRKYKVYPLALSEMAHEKQKQNWRRQCVGNDNEHNTKNKVFLGVDGWDKFAEKYPEDLYLEKKLYEDRDPVAILKM